MRVFACVLLLPLFASAQSTHTGTITGRILNPATGEYVRNAEVRIESTGQSAVSGASGGYRLTQVPPGEVTVNVIYTGYTTATATLNVAPGAAVTCDFDLRSAFAHDGAVVKLDQFVVSSAREGNAKAIMDQRNSMNITSSVASEVFGDVTEGNVGEFLKHLPGVDINLVAGEVRNVRLSGLGSEYVGVTLDGMALASADAVGSAAGSRAFSFEQVSLNSMDSIEVSKTVSADVDANAPAGTINLKTKRAFDRKGRRVTLQANLTAFSDEFHLRRTQGPDDNRSRKILPGGFIEYSDVFFNNRLGVVLNISESNVYSGFSRVTTTYSFTTTAADPRPGVVTAVTHWNGPRTNERSTATLTMDFKATPALVLSLGLIYNNADLWYVVRQAAFNAGARTTVVGASPLLSFTTSNAASVNVSPTGVSKLGESATYMPRFEYKQGDLTIEGKFSVSESKSWYDPLNERGSFYLLNSPTVNGVRFHAERSSLTTADWKITQLAGPDWSNGANYTTPTVSINDGRTGRTQLYAGEVTGTLSTQKFLPVVWKTGVKMNREIRDFNLSGDSMLYSYRGGAAGGWASFPTSSQVDLGPVRASEASLSGGRVFMPNMLAIGQLFRDHPTEFTQTMTATNFYNAYIANKKHYVEDINAAFAMATTRVGQIQLRAGLRWEDTATDALEVDPRTAAEVVAAGFPVASSRATTIPGMQYQFFSKPKVHRTGGYDHFFPSGSVKYRIIKNIDLQVGFSRTIRRPTFRDVAGVWVINDTAFTVSAPNPNLPPERSENLSARLAYYFEPVGILAVSLYQKNVDGLHQSNRMSAAEYGYDGDLNLKDFEFITTTSSSDRTKIRGLEFEYSQSLSFLPGPLKDLGVRAAYSRNTAEAPNPNMTPHFVSGGLNYHFGRVNLHASANWTDDVPTNVTGTTYNRHRTNVDGGGGLRFTNRLSLFFTVRNILNAPLLQMQQVGENPAVVQVYQTWGTNWTFGIKMVF